LNCVCFGGLPRPIFGIVSLAAGGSFALLTLVTFFVALPAISCLPKALVFDILKALIRLGVGGLQAVNAVEPPENRCREFFLSDEAVNLSCLETGPVGY